MPNVLRGVVIGAERRDLSNVEATWQKELLIARAGKVDRFPLSLERRIST